MEEYKMKLKTGDVVDIDGHIVAITEVHSAVLIDSVSFTIYARDIESAQKIQAEQIKGNQLQNNMLDMLKKMFNQLHGNDFPGSDLFKGGE